MNCGEGELSCLEGDEGKVDCYGATGGDAELAAPWPRRKEVGTLFKGYAQVLGDRRVTLDNNLVINDLPENTRGRKIYKNIKKNHKKNPIKIMKFSKTLRLSIVNIGVSNLKGLIVAFEFNSTFLSVSFSPASSQSSLF